MLNWPPPVLRKLRGDGVYRYGHSVEVSPEMMGRHGGLMKKLSLIFFALGTLLCTPALAEKRIALVIGNNSYRNLSASSQLQMAVNDAQAVGDALVRLGFQVIRGANLTRQETVDKLSEFTAKLSPGDTAAFFYAGHGVAIGGVNYIVPSDVPAVTPDGELRVRGASIAEGDIIGELQNKGVRVALLVLDACRDNPFPHSNTRAIGSSRGLTDSRPARGIFTIYSAGIGQTALDRLEPNDASRNSVFTRVFVEQLVKPGLDLSNLAIEVRERVAQLALSAKDDTGRLEPHEQTPAYYDQTIGGRVYLAGLPKPGAIIPGEVPSDEKVWSTVKDTNEPSQLRRFLEQFPTSPRRDEAMGRLTTLERARGDQPKIPPISPKSGPLIPPNVGTFVEEDGYYRVTIGGRSYRLEALTVKRGNAVDRLPIALIAHGKPTTQQEMLDEHPRRYISIARDLAARGWLAVVVMRRGFGNSDGQLQFPLNCQSTSLIPRFTAEADDLAATFDVIAQRPDADRTRMIAIGAAAGGAVVTALGARNPTNLSAVINISGGLRIEGCSSEELMLAALKTFGGKSRVPALWMYAKNDSISSPELVGRMRDVYVGAGGDAKMVMFDAIGQDGLSLFSRGDGRYKWLPGMDSFLRSRGLPTWETRHVDSLLNRLNVGESNRTFLQGFLAAPFEKALARAPSDNYMFAGWGYRTVEDARKAALEGCNIKRPLGHCAIVMENDDLIADGNEPEARR